MSAQISNQDNAILDQIWEGDVFDRKREATDLVAYIESLGKRPSLREDKRAYTITVDAPYGFGKTFFLRRLSKHLGVKHPVAFVDAWADDLADEPLTALAATLQEALEPFMAEPEVRRRLSDFMSKAGKVAKIGGVGLFRRGLGFFVGHQAVDAMSDVFDDADPDKQDEIKKAIAKASDEIAEETQDALAEITGHSLMERRVEEFREGKEAIAAMKLSLEGVVGAFSQTGKEAPIVIVIDELDRCRPTYAIKLLEEIKHLFDVPGLVFVMAMHATQLSHSVSAAYGAKFDGQSYLRRFIDRKYTLAEPSLDPLVKNLLDLYGITTIKFEYPEITILGEAPLDVSFAEVLSEYMRVYDLGARDTFVLVDMLQTCVALCQGHTLSIPYLIPLAIGQIKGAASGELPEPIKTSDWRYIPNWSRQNQDSTTFTLPGFAEEIKNELGKGWQYYQEISEQGHLSYAQRLGSRDCQVIGNGALVWTPSGFPRLLQAVTRFESPQVAHEPEG
ncbi:KAP family NTPase [Qipengyuania sp. SS22]|uniref:KAP family P-loop NTPase fold protein n=1 Tax=Qipengyuania sp. SS22 TaxID=2979461 RepID=UPI0021E5A461|nr:KAP family NTPase [Qipengyuania sp. SS22]UYH55555.1 KAP family NTPase [Qipengyuania sp. SS22]